MADPTVIVVKGPDRELRTRTLEELVPKLLGDDDRTLALEETYLPPRSSKGEESGGEARAAAMGTALAGARTPPFGTSKRVVVVRTDEPLTAKDDGGEGKALDLLVRYLADPEPTTALVFESVGKPPAELTKALKAAKAQDVGGVVHKDATGSVLRDQLSRAGIVLDRAAMAMVIERLGEDTGRVPALVDLLTSTFGRGASLGSDDVAMYLGRHGPIPVFELTKAIDSGEAADALVVLDTMMGSMEMHPLQIMAILHKHFRRALRVHDPSIADKRDAKAAIDAFETRPGRKVNVHEFPAELAWKKANRMGIDGIRRAFALLAKADRDLRGGSGAPDDAIIAVLVTELSTLSKRGAPVRSRG
ncbi:MAG TPA: hypothetical protein VI916_05805 [Acidimicrobiia bacterium]|nr:hypothetical protein [Acidimicrobiia bacterium]